MADPQQVNHLAGVPVSFCAARVLQSAALYDGGGPPAPLTANDHLVTWQ